LYTWNRGGSGAGINPQVISRIPLEAQKIERSEGMIKTQKDIDVLNKNTSIYHTRAERTLFLTVVVNKTFVNNATAQAIFEFITADVISLNYETQDSAEAAKYVPSCPDSDIILDMRMLNSRPNINTFDPFWAKMAELVNERVCDRHHGELMHVFHIDYFYRLINMFFCVDLARNYIVHLCCYLYPRSYPIKNCRSTTASTFSKDFGGGKSSGAKPYLGFSAILRQEPLGKESPQLYRRFKTGVQGTTTYIEGYQHRLTLRVSRLQVNAELWIVA